MYILGTSTQSATYKYIRGGTPSNGFQPGTLRISLVCGIVKMRKVLNQNPLLGVPLMLRHCGGGDRIGETVKATDLEDKLGEHIGETVLVDTPR